MHIHQLSIQYVSEHDRMLARFNTSAHEEFRLWLTRRLVQHWWPDLQQIAADVEARRLPLAAGDDASRHLLADLKRAETLQHADFSQVYEDTPDVQLPLGEAPLLVTEIRMQPLDGGRLQMGFAEQLKDQDGIRSFDMQMDASLLHALMHLLELSVAKSEWSTGLPMAPTDPRILAVDGERPRFLN